jgi:hypothetical protein
MAAATGLPRREVYRVIADLAFEAVVALRDGRRFDLDEVRVQVRASVESDRAATSA